MEVQNILNRLTGIYPELSPMLQRAAKHVLNAPEDVAVRSMRGLAEQAKVTPTTMIRLAKVLDFPGFDAFREPFQEAVVRQREGLAGKAEWLQDLSSGGAVENVMSKMAKASLDNVETVFRQVSPKDLKQAADLIAKAPTTYIVGVGAAHTVGAYFRFIANMVLPNIVIADPVMGIGIDDLALIGEKDVMLSICISPYARSTVSTVEFAVERGATVISITDNRTSPTAPEASLLFVVPTQSPQFFPSFTATISLLETIIALIVARGGRRSVKRIETIENFRINQGLCAGVTNEKDQ